MPSPQSNTMPFGNSKRNVAAGTRDLELIKESVFEIFRIDNAEDAKKQFETTGEWIIKAGFPTFSKLCRSAAS